MLGKQRRLPFVKHMLMRAKHVLNVVSYDICGPFETLSCGGSKYFISFVYEFSRMFWVYLIKTKGEALNMFKRFKAMAEKQSGRLIKILKTDGGREYNSHEFKHFCHENGILHEVTPP